MIYIPLEHACLVFSHRQQRGGADTIMFGALSFHPIGVQACQLTKEAHDRDKRPSIAIGPGAARPEHSASVRQRHDAEQPAPRCVNRSRQFIYWIVNRFSTSRQVHKGSLGKMSAITLYGAAYSTCTQRVLITLHELDLDYKLSPIEMKLGEHKVRRLL